MEHYVIVGKEAVLKHMQVLKDLKKKLQNVAVVVVRYFGGIKLGAGGFVRAYTKSASEALKGE